MIRKTRWMLCLLGMLLALLLTGCGGDNVVKTGDGLEYYPVKGMGGFDFLKYWNGEDAWACNIEHFTGTSLTVPATFRNKPVIAVWGSSGTITDLRIGDGILAVENAALRSLETVVIPPSVVCLDEAFKSARLTEVTIPGNIDQVSWLSFNNCASLEKVTFLGDVGTVSSSFWNCPKLKEVVFSGSVGALTEAAFSSCPALKSVVLPAETAVGDNVFRQPEEYDAAYLPEGVAEYCRQYQLSELESAARAAAGTAFDPEKKISPEEAANYADRLNGPVLFTDQCPDCFYTDYAPEVLPDSLEIRAVDVGEIEYFHSGTVYLKEKADNVRNGSAPLVYCLCETAGYSKGPEYTLSVNNYYLWYRVSLWEAGTNTLVAWYEARNGYAPDSFTIGKDRVFFPIVFSGGSKDFFLEKDGTKPTPFSRVMRDFFPGSAAAGRPEIIRR